MTVAILSVAFGLFYAHQAVKHIREREAEDQRSADRLRRMEEFRVRMLRSVEVSNHISPEGKRVE